jgi:hypothetical protein
MPASYPAAPRSHRPFIVTPYVADSDGVLQAEMPSSCPFGAGAAEPCPLSRNHLRSRKTGPKHPLAVVRCRAHHVAFTLYPPGYAPRRRQPVERLSPGGQPVEADPDASSFTGTLFEAAADARAGRAWTRDGDICDRPPERWWSTQGRHLEFAVRLVGAAAELTDKVRETVAAALSIGVLTLREKATAGGYRAIGDAVCSIVAAVGSGARRSRRLLLAGHLVGHWGEPMHWDPRRRSLRRAPFRACEQGAGP